MRPTALPYALIVSLSLLFVNDASAQSAGAPAALFKAHEEVVTELDRAAAIINSAVAFFSMQSCTHSAWKFTVSPEGTAPWWLAESASC